jgi:homoserine O-acetyltransferase
VFIANKTYGTLNEDKSNVVIFPTSFADQHVDNEWLIGQDKALDPRKYFIICTKLLGNGLSSSPSNTLPPFDKSNFPTVTIHDNIFSQHQLVIQKFGIEKVALVTGWSMGAVQTMEWATSYPNMVERIAPFAGTAKTWPHNQVFIEGLKSIIQFHPEWKNGWYEKPPVSALRTFGRVYAGWGFSQAFYRESLFRELGYSTVEDFIEQFWEQSFINVDANDILTMLWTWQHADISKNDCYQRDFEKALQSIQAYATIMPVTTDLYFTLEDSQFEATQIPNAKFRPIRSKWGHLAGYGLNDQDIRYIDSCIKELLHQSIISFEGERALDYFEVRREDRIEGNQKSPAWKESM